MAFNPCERYRVHKLAPDASFRAMIEQVKRGDISHLGNFSRWQVNAAILGGKFYGCPPNAQEALDDISDSCKESM